MKTHRIDLKPASSDRAQMFWRDSHELTVYLGLSRQPLFDAARLLLELGAEPDDRIETWRGSTKCLSGPVGAAAKLEVTGKRFRLFKADRKPFKGSPEAPG